MGVVDMVEYIEESEEYLTGHEGKWISVKKQVPMFHINCLVYSEEFKEVGIGYYYQGMGWSVYDNGLTHIKKTITHWMYVPRMPYEECEEESDMEDGQDRECCDTFKKVLMDSIPEGWKLRKVLRKDPGWQLVFYHPESDFATINKVVTVTVAYGRKG